MVFFATLIVVSLFTVRLSDAILDSKIGALDRTLGFRLRRRARISARGGRIRDLQLAGFGQAATGMGENRQDPPDPDGYGGQDRGLAAGGRGGDHRSLDQVAREQSRRRTKRPVDDESNAPTGVKRRRRLRRRPQVAQRKAGRAGALDVPTDKQKLDALINGRPVPTAPKQ